MGRSPGITVGMGATEEVAVSVKCEVEVLSISGWTIMMAAIGMVLARRMKTTTAATLDGWEVLHCYGGR